MRPWQEENMPKGEPSQEPQHRTKTPMELRPDWSFAMDAYKL